MKNINFLLGMSALLVLGACGGEEEGKTEKKGGPITVETYTAQPEPVEHIIEVPGTVLPFEAVEIYSELNGRVQKIHFKEGQYVQKGAALIQMDTDVLQAQRKQLKVELDLAEKDERRKKALLASKALSSEEYERSLSNLNSLQAQVELLDVQISKGTIRAPFSGKVGLRTISEGAYLTPSTLITTLAQNDQLKIEFSVAERYAGKVKSGQEITVKTADDTTGRTAEVYASAATINEQSRMLTVRAAMPSSETLFPGSFVNVSYNMGIDKNSILVPNSAIVPVMKGQKIWVLRDGKAVSIAVETGIKTAQRTQIFGDISAGDTVIITGLLGLRDGVPVISKTATK